MKRFLIGIMLAAVAIIGVGCGGPPELEKWVEVKPDETAFLIKLEGENKQGQAKFNSVEYLESQKVATKRIILPQRKKSLGRGMNNFEWVPTATVIKISRRPVQREWVGDMAGPQDPRTKKIRVETLDSIGIGMGANIMALVEESDASTFLYYFNGQQLDEIIDGPVKGFAQSVMSQAVGQVSWENLKSEKNKIAQATFESVAAQFKPMGITVKYFGLAEGLELENAEIQKAIDAQAVAASQILVESNKKLANDKRRENELADAQLKVSVAQATADAAKKAAEAKEAMSFEVELFERRQRALALPELAKNFSNIKILPSSSPLLLELGLTDDK